MSRPVLPAAQISAAGFLWGATLTAAVLAVLLLGEPVSPPAIDGGTSLLSAVLLAYAR